MLRAVRAVRAALPRGVRGTGNKVRGADWTDVPAQADLAAEYFTKPKLSYDAYKHQLEAVRLFVFVGVCGALTLDLMLRPLKSSYFYHVVPADPAAHPVRLYG